MWVVCTVCGAIVAEFNLHADWHEANGEPRPVNPNDPPVEPELIEEVPNGG